MKGLKKLFVLGILASLVLAACSSSKLNFSEIERVPSHVQDLVDSSLTLQSITNDAEGKYIIFHSSGNVKSDLETKGDTVTIKFNVTNLGDVVKQHTYYFTSGPKHDVLDVTVNGESIPFDNATID
ncbi:peptidylprolyl isomerase [Psychrobacillus sp. MER TA 171]|uniref:peptidylprolyl isomerase n=1 Tax=Psychrobacillus sp. MER TA 171 TaxID=2939577 RepID=UPI0020410173|nr:peptidylprolyl isomerase [Psychrobacillus sp. MER TA 171]